MIVGICKIEMRLFEIGSLKEKRMVIKSILGKTNARFNATLAETGDNDLWNKAEIGIACISTSVRHANEVMDKITHFIDNDGRVEIVARETEYISL